MSNAEKIAADIVSAFAVHNFNLGNGKLEAEPCDELRAAIADALLAERERCASVALNRAAICRAAFDAGDLAEVNPLNEALHIAQLIRYQKPI